MDKEQIIREFADVVNRHSLENETDTPDFVLGEYLFSCLENWNKLFRKRRKWYGVEENE